MEKIIKFSSWSELLKAIPEYVRLGFECEVRGWEGMQHNKLTIMEEEADGLDMDYQPDTDRGRVQ